MSRGLLAGKTTAVMTAGDSRVHFPRWRGDNQARNLTMVRALQAIASEKNATTSQLALAWSAPVDRISCRLPERVRAYNWKMPLKALDVSLSADDLRRIEAAVPEAAVAGSRYAEPQMRMLDSER